MSLNIASEYRVLMLHLMDTFRVPNIPDFWNAGQIAFARGLHDARFFVREDVLISVAEAVNGKGSVTPLAGWRTYPCPQLYHDALWCFYFSLQGALSSLRAAAVQGSGFDFKRNAEALLSELNESFNLSGMTPVPRRPERQQVMIDKFAGYKSDEQRAVLNKLSYDAVCARQETVSPENIVMAAIYEFGLLCAEHNNTVTLKMTLRSIFLHYRRSMFNPGNGDDILALARQHLLFPILEVLHPFQFSSAERFEASLVSKGSGDLAMDENDLDDICSEIEAEERALAERSDLSPIIQHAKYLELARQTLPPH